MMEVWWNGLSHVLKILYCIAIPATLIFVIQTFLSFIGGLEGGEGIHFSDTSGLDLDTPDMDFIDASDIGELSHDISEAIGAGDGAVLRVLTLQGMVAFLTVFGWSSIAAIQSGGEEAASIFLGVILGLVAMLAVAKLIQLSAKLAENGTTDLKNAIGEMGRVYLPIPRKGGGEGKIMVQIQGSYMECSAISEGEEGISTGSNVRVVDMIGNVLVVEKEEGRE